MIELTSRFRGSVEVSADPDEVYAVISNVPDSVAHFPVLEALTEENGGFTWVLKKLGAGKLSARCKWASRYEVDPEARTVTWTPIPGVGNSTVSGGWTVQETPRGSRLTMRNDLVFRVNAPRIFRRAAEPVFARENDKVLNTYLANLKKTFDGGDGRVC